MDATAQRELSSIKSELRSIIREMKDISDGLKSDFEGIGSEKCAKAVLNAVSQLEYANQKLNNLNTTAVTESYAAAHSGGGGTSRGGGASRKF